MSFWFTQIGHVDRVNKSEIFDLFCTCVFGPNRTYCGLGLYLLKKYVLQIKGGYDFNAKSVQPEFYRELWFNHSTLRLNPRCDVTMHVQSHELHHRNAGCLRKFGGQCTYFKVVVKNIERSE